MFKELNLQKVSDKNIKKLVYGNPYSENYARDLFRKKTAFYPSPEWFESDKSKDLLIKMKNQITNKDDSVLFNSYKLESFDKKQIDSLEIIPKNVDKSPVAIVNVFGAVDAYEQNIKMMKMQSKRTGSINIGFNVPGVGFSTGKLDSKDKAINSAIAQVGRLVEKGVDPTKIILSGHSVGAAIAVLAAEHLHKKGLKVHVFHNRSYGDISKAYSRLITEEGNVPSKNQVKTPPKVKAADDLVTLISGIAGWDMDVNKSYSNIPPHNKDYIIIKPNKHDRQIMTGDQMVRYNASLHNMQLSERRKVKSLIKDSLSKCTSIKNLESVSKSLDSLKKIFHGSTESRNIIIGIQNNISQIQKTANTPNLEKTGVTKVINNLKTLYNVNKFERKFLPNIDKLIKDVGNKKIVLEKYHERCDRFVLDRKDSIEKNLKIIESSESAFAKWMRIGLVTGSKMSPKEKSSKVHALALKMDVHAIPLEYIVQRKEKQGKQITGLEYYDNYIKMKNHNKTNHNNKSKESNFSMR